MSAPVITSITADAPVTVKYPKFVSVRVRWDQPVHSFSFKNLIVETEQEPGITVTGYPGSFDKPPKMQRVYLGQTLCSNTYVNQTDPYTTSFQFQVSPFADGPFRISQQPWNKPLELKVLNSAGEEGDWSPLLAPGALSMIVGEPTNPYSWGEYSPSVLPDEKIAGYPKIKYDWTWHTISGGAQNSNLYTDFSQRIGSGPNNWQSPSALPTWSGGNFWWWEAAGCNYGAPSGAEGIPASGFNYYSSSDPRTCRGPSNYLFGGYGGLGVDTTFMPVFGPTVQPYNLKNQWGSPVANNMNIQSAKASLALYLYNPQTIFGSAPSTTNKGQNWALGRWEGWLLANPQNGDPLKDMPASWTKQQQSSANNQCLAPWRLAKDTDPVPILIQAYFQYDWIFYYSLPPSS